MALLQSTFTSTSFKLCLSMFATVHVYYVRSNYACPCSFKLCLSMFTSSMFTSSMFTSSEILCKTSSSVIFFYTTLGGTTAAYKVTRSMTKIIPHHKFARFAICLILPLSGCATYNPGDADLMFNEIIVYNRGSHVINNVELRVEKFNRIFACSPVTSKKICSNAFNARKYEGNVVTISWTDTASTYNEGPMTIEMPDSYSSHIIHTAIIEIDNDEVHSAYFRENASWM